MIDITFTGSGHLAVTDFLNGRVLLIHSKGDILADSRDMDVELQRPHGITYDSRDDSLLVCDYKAGCIVILDPLSLAFKGTITPDEISSPWGIAMLSSGYIAVTEGNTEGTGKVGVFSTQGRKFNLWNRLQGTTKFGFPHFVAADDDDRLYVSDWGHNKIVKFSLTHGYLMEWNTEGTPWGVAAYEDSILVSEWCRPDCVMAYTNQGIDPIQVLDWPSEAGKIKSVASQGDSLAVLGLNTLKMCKMITSTNTY